MNLSFQNELFEMKIKISGTFEGKCSICKKESNVFSAGDDETHKAVTICKECADKMGDKTLEDAIKEYGKKDNKAFDEGVKIKRKATAG